MFTRCHHIVHDATSPQALAEGVCRAAVDELGYRLAWIGLVEDEGTRVRPIGQAGFDEGYVERLVVHASDDAHGRGPTGTAVRERRPSVCRAIADDPSYAPWRADALARGYGSSAAIPLLEGTRAIGAMNLYAVEPGAFDEREIALLEEVALDVTLGIAAMRTREQGAPVDALSRTELACAVAAAVAHDLQNMLGVVRLSLADMARRLPAHTADAAYRDADAAVASAAELARQVLVLSNRASAATASVDVEACIRGTEPLLRRIAGPEATISFELRAGAARVALAGIDLQRIVINLVVNAVQAGGPRVRVEVTTELADDHVVVRVRDDGPGVPAEIVPRVFDPSFTTKGKKGAGLGLASVAQLVEKAHGTVSLASESGRGALFTVRLPRAIGAR